MDELSIPTSVGDFAAIDYGGDGVPVLALHDVCITNAASWGPVYEHLEGRVRLVALDREGHGRTSVPASPAIDFPRTLAEIVTHLGFVGEDAPVLVGSGSGGWDVTAAVVSGAVAARGIVTTEAAYCVPMDALGEYIEQFADPGAGTVWASLELGWTGSEAEAEELVAKLVAAHARNWVLNEFTPEQWEATVRRSFVPDGDVWRRQPSFEALGSLTFGRMQQEPHPGPAAFAALDLPATFLLADGGMIGYFAREIEEMVASDPRRRMRVLPSVNNLMSTHPHQIAVEVLRLAGADLAGADAAG